MDGEIPMHQPEVPYGGGQPPAELHRRPIVILIVVAIILVGVIIWIGNWALRQEATEPAARLELTDAQKQQILDSLRAPSNTSPLTDEQKTAIMDSLKAPSNARPLTEAQKQAIFESLK